MSNDNAGNAAGIRIGVIFGGPSPEHDVSILTGLQASRALNAAGRDVASLYWSKTGDWYLVSESSEASDFADGVPRTATRIRFVADTDGGFVHEKKTVFGKSRSLDIDVVVNCCHGGPGEDGSLQGALDLAGMAYTGPNVAGAGLTMDKYAFGAVVADAGLPGLPRVLLTNETTDVGFAGPYIVKPRFGGSSIGIEIVDSIETARAMLRSSPHFRAGAVVEPYKPDSYDLNVAVRSYPTPQVSVIEKPIRRSGDTGILDYTSKYIGGEGMVSAPREIPARVSPHIAEQLRAAALRIIELADVRGSQRLDFLVDDETLYVNEINTIPGSLAKYLWIDPQIDFATLLGDMIDEARGRALRHWTTVGADGTALASAGSIAGKLA